MAENDETRCIVCARPIAHGRFNEGPCANFAGIAAPTFCNYGTDRDAFVGFKCHEIGYYREREARQKAEGEVARLRGERTFPLQQERKGYDKPQFIGIPWSVAERAYAAYAGRYGKGQSLERLAERGGFGHREMDEFHPTWREECGEIARLRSALAAKEAEVAEVRESREGYRKMALLREREATEAKAALAALREEGARVREALRLDWERSGRLVGALRDGVEVLRNLMVPPGLVEGQVEALEAKFIDVLCRDGNGPRDPADIPVPPAGHDASDHECGKQPGECESTCRPDPAPAPVFGAGPVERLIPVVLAEMKPAPAPVTQGDAVALLRELTALVRGECPSLLNEDSGGNADLDARIDAIIAAPVTTPGCAACDAFRAAPPGTALPCLEHGCCAAGKQTAIGRCGSIGCNACYGPRAPVTTPAQEGEFDYFGNRINPRPAPADAGKPGEVARCSLCRAQRCDMDGTPGACGNLACPDPMFDYRRERPDEYPHPPPAAEQPAKEDK